MDVNDEERAMKTAPESALPARSRWGLAAVCLAVGLLAVPSTAAAGRVVHTLKGGIAGDANARVKMKVVVRNGDPRRVKGLSYRNLDADCNGTPAGQLSGSAGRNLGPGVEFDNSFRWVSFPANPPRQVNMVGKLKRRGRKATGRLEVGSNESCANTDDRVTLRK